MSVEDRIRWDERHTAAGPPATDSACLAAPFRRYEDIFPISGHALDIGCGQGRGAVWLARHGLRVQGLDISEVAVTAARDLARRNGVGDRCRFDTVDLDDGLPAGQPADVIYCCRFRDPRLDRAVVQRLAPGGLLALAVLSRTPGVAGRFRVGADELRAAFADLELIAAGTSGAACGGASGGQAWLLARRGGTGGEPPAG